MAGHVYGTRVEESCVGKERIFRWYKQHLKNKKLSYHKIFSELSCDCSLFGDLITP